MTVEKNDVLDGLLAALRLHDPDLAAHCDATAELANRLAVGAGLDQQTTFRATLGGRLHDIGKMRVSRAILAKPLPLTVAEYAEAKSYATASADALAALPLLSNIAPVVRAHREWVDGRGYPEALRCGEIPVESRVIAIADTFHTLTLARPYRKPLSPSEALAEVIAGRGTQFDAELVDVFASLVGYRARTARTA